MAGPIIMDSAHALPAGQFLEVVQHAPLVCVHLLCRRRGSLVLLGLRQNRPAQDMWAAPGGRVYKGERVTDALKRIAKKELSLVLNGWPPAKLIGTFEHMHPDNVTGEGSFGTHEITLAWEVDLDDKTAASIQTDRQHRALRWWDTADIRNHPQVHEFTRAYFDYSIKGTRLA